MKLSDVTGAAPAAPDQAAKKKLSEIGAAPLPSVPRSGLTPQQDAAVSAASPPVQQGDRGVVAGIGHSLADIPAEMGRETQRAKKNIAGDFTRPVKPGIMPKVLRAGKTLSDVADYVTSPITGALTSTVGRPVESITGIPKRQVSQNIEMATPVGFGAGKSAALKDGAKAVEKLLSPTTVSASARQTERTIRRATGQGSLEAEKSAAELIKHSPLVGNLPVPEQRGLIDYIENRSTRSKLANPKLQAAADAISKVYDRYRARIEYILGPENSPTFIKDYYSHLWKEKPEQVADTLNAFYAKQGSSRSLKKRVIPTISDGIKLGLTPRQENPIEATMTYVQNMSRYLATHDIQQEMKGLGYFKFYAPGKAPAGWKEVEGINTTRNPVIKGPDGQPKAMPMKAYAPEGAARVYNNFISKGFEQKDAVAPFYRAARAGANGLTMLKLGLSTFHLSTMANEGIVGQVAKSIGQLSRGQIGEAGKTLAKALASPVLLPLRGKRMGEEMVGRAVPSAADAKLNDLYVKAGGRLRMDPFYRTRASGSFYNAIEKGTFKRELGDAAKRLYTGSAADMAKAHIDLVGNAIQSVSAPLFEKYIPAIKRGAFASRMEDFMKANPMASDEELNKYAIKLNDSIDNRFGELNQDNLFWHKQMKQLAQIALLSFSWDLGTVREIGGGIADAIPSAKGIMEGKGITDRTAYVAALAATTALENGIATYLKTGTAPKGRDFMAYRTGGTDATSGEPERAMMPGYQKDVYAFGYNFPHNVIPEMENKLNPALTAAWGMTQNKDYRGLPITRPQGAAPVPGEPGMLDFLLDTAMPISIGQFSKGMKKGSNISLPERALSIKPATSYITAPERQESLRDKYDTLEWRRRLKSDARAKARQQ